MSLSVIEWKRTTSQYIAILQALDNFEPGTIKEIKRKGFEIVLGGKIRGTDEVEWYALAYDRRELEFDEARQMARDTVQRLRDEERSQY